MITYRNSILWKRSVQIFFLLPILLLFSGACTHEAERGVSDFNIEITGGGNAPGAVLPSSGGSAEPAAEAPGAPQNLIAVAGDASATLIWDKLDGAESYNLYWGDAPGVTVANTKIEGAVSPQLIDSGLDNAKTYYFIVTAVNKNGEGPPSNEASATPAKLSGSSPVLSPAAKSYFGTSVAISADYAIVGAPKEEVDYNGTKINSGAAYILKRDANGDWKIFQKILPSDPDAKDGFGQSVAIQDQFAIVGAPLDENEPATAQDVGVAYVFSYDNVGNKWQQSAVLNALDSVAKDHFGSAISMDKEYAVIGAEKKDAGALVESGAAYVFKRDGLAWSQVRKLMQPMPLIMPYSHYGHSVSMSDDYLFVGAPLQKNGTYSEAGQVYVYEKEFGQDNWVTKTTLTPSTNQAHCYFGASLSVHAGFAVIGSPGEKMGGVGLGVGGVYSYRLDGGNWVVQQMLGASDGVPGDQFGYSVSLNNNMMIAGAPFKGTLKEGAAYTFIINNLGQLSGEKKMELPSPEQGVAFGSSVSVNMGAFAVGVPGANQGNGAVYFYK